jgi:excisionase family DNA binding protein
LYHSDAPFLFLFLALPVRQALPATPCLTVPRLASPDLNLFLFPVPAGQLGYRKFFLRMRQNDLHHFLILMHNLGESKLIKVVSQMSKQLEQTFVLVDIAALKAAHRAEFMEELQASRNEKPITPEEFAELYNMDVQFVYRLLRRGDLPGRKFGKLWRIFLSEVRAMPTGSVSRPWTNIEQMASV